jgi:endonuclease/exonuclease/phosphatase family metal-dependent hydrolase
MNVARALLGFLVLVSACADSPPPRRSFGGEHAAVALASPTADPDGAAERPATGPLLKLLTFNVNYGMAGDASSVRAIAEHDADVVLLQETNSEWERAIRRRVGTQYRDVRFHDPQRFAPGGSGVLSKLPIEKETIVPSAVDWFPASILVVRTEAGPVQLVNVHLRPMVSDSGSWVSGYFTTGDYRKREIAAIERALDPKLPTVWAGDFNEAEDAGGIAGLWHKGFTSALPEKDPRATTWRWTYEGVPLALRLDHVLYDRERFALVDVAVHEQGRSDHFPVTATLRLREN